MDTISGLTQGKFAQWDKQLTSSHPFHQQVTRRLSRLAEIPVDAIAQIADLVIGSIATVGSLGMLGMSSSVYEASCVHLRSGGDIVADAFASGILVLNPNAKLGKHLSLTDRMHSAFKNSNIGPKLSHSDNLLARHILSRLAYLARGLVSIVTRIIDLVVGLLAAVPAIITFGNFETLNGMAYSGLQAPRIGADLGYSLIKMVNPSVRRVRIV